MNYLVRSGRVGLIERRTREQRIMDLNALRSRDLNQLKVLLALLTMRSVTKAAQELDVSQLAVSKTLDRLRRELGDPLLVREGNQRRKIIS